MAYEKIGFTSGQKLTADNMNHIEDGIESGGIYFTPSVDSSGNLSWSNNGGLTNPTTVNIKGAAGNLGFGIVNVTPTTELEYNDGDMENMLNTQISITTTSNNLRAGDTLICPYYNTDSFTYKIFAGEIKSFSISTKTATVLVKWFLT